MGLRRSGFLALLVTLVVVTTGCDWSMSAFGPAHTSFNPGETIVGVGNVASLQEAWTAVLGPAQGGSVAPVTSAGVVYATSDASPFKLEAFDAHGVNGCSGSPKHCAPLWTATMGSGPISLDVRNGFVYVTTITGRLLAFDAAGVKGCSGTPKRCTAIWLANGLNGATGEPAITAEFVYAPYATGVAVFDAAGVAGCSGAPKTCTPLWRVAGSSPAVANGVLYTSLVAQTFEVRAYDAAGIVNCKGTPKGCATLWVGDSGINRDVLSYATAPTVSNGIVWIGIDNGDEFSNGGHLVGFSAAGTAHCGGTPKRCTPLWQARTDGGVVYPPAVAKNTVYALQFFHSGETEITTRYTLSAFDLVACRTTTEICTPRWTVAFDSRSSGLAVANGLVYVSASADRIDAFDAAGVNGCSGAPRTCSAVWSTTLTGTPTSPVIANGVLFVGTRDDNVLHAYALP